MIRSPKFLSIAQISPLSCKLVHRKDCLFDISTSCFDISNLTCSKWILSQDYFPSSPASPSDHNPPFKGGSPFTPFRSHFYYFISFVPSIQSSCKSGIDSVSKRDRKSTYFYLYCHYSTPGHHQPCLKVLLLSPNWSPCFYTLPPSILFTSLNIILKCEFSHFFFHVASQCI